MFAVVNVSSTVCHKGACSALVLLDLQSGYHSQHWPVSWKRAGISWWHRMLWMRARTSTRPPLPKYSCSLASFTGGSLLLQGITTLTFLSDKVCSCWESPGRFKPWHCLQQQSSQQLFHTRFAPIQELQEKCFVQFFHITDLCSDISAAHRATHPCSPGWRKLAGVSQQESITPEWKGAFLSPLALRFGEGVSNRDVAEQEPVRLNTTPFPL